MSRNTRSIVFVIGLVAMAIDTPAIGADPVDWRLEAVSEKRKYLLGEPVRVQVKITNVSAQAKSLRIGPALRSIEIASDGNAFEKVNAEIPLQVLGDRLVSHGEAYPTIDIPSGKSVSFEETIYLTYISSRQNGGATFWLAFPEAGHYTVRIQQNAATDRDGNKLVGIAEAGVVIVSPEGRDRAAWDVFSYPGVFFTLKYGSIGRIVDNDRFVRNMIKASIDRSKTVEQRDSGKRRLEEHNKLVALMGIDEVEIGRRIDELKKTYGDTAYASLLRQAASIEEKRDSDVVDVPDGEWKRLVADHPKKYEAYLDKLNDLDGLKSDGQIDRREHDRLVNKALKEFLMATGYEPGAGNNSSK